MTGAGDKLAIGSADRVAVWEAHAHAHAHAQPQSADRHGLRVSLGRSGQKASGSANTTASVTFAAWAAACNDSLMTNSAALCSGFDAQRGGRAAGSVTRRGVRARRFLCAPSRSCGG
eukprot:6207390-Pleurochrysis_carterae.AAC.1